MDEEVIINEDHQRKTKERIDDSVVKDFMFATIVNDFNKEVQDYNKSILQKSKGPNDAVGQILKSDSNNQIENKDDDEDYSNENGDANHDQAEAGDDQDHQ